MKKQVTAREAKQAVLISKSVGMQVGAFFIVGYPGETNETILDTLKFASLIPLDYLSFTLPYPIPGTPLYDRVEASIEVDDWNEPRHRSLIEHKLLYRGSFSEAKLKFAIFKASAQFRLRKTLGHKGYRVFGEPSEHLTDRVFKLLP
jgi:anaerobic magnesium-protoporphyrin IX monomethyl ester cyclase